MQPDKADHPMGDAPTYTAPPFRGVPQHPTTTTPCAVYKPSAPPAVSLTAQLDPQGSHPDAANYAQQWVQAVADAKQHTPASAAKALPPAGLVLAPSQSVHAPTLHFSYQPRLGTLNDAAYRAMLATTAIPPCDGTMQPRQHYPSVAYAAPSAHRSGAPPLLPHLSNPVARQPCDVQSLLGTVVDGPVDAEARGTTSMRLAAPCITVGYQGEWLDVSPSCVQLWDKAGLQPYAPPKGVHYLVIAPEGQQLRVRRYMQGLQSVFQGSGLGIHAVAEGQQPPYAIWEYVPWAASEHPEQLPSAVVNGTVNGVVMQSSAPRSRGGTPAALGPSQSVPSPSQAPASTPPLGRPSSRVSQLPPSVEGMEPPHGLSLTDVAMRLQQLLLVDPPTLRYHTALASGEPDASLVVYAVPPSDHPSDVRDMLSVLLVHLSPLMQQVDAATKAPAPAATGPSPLTHPSPDPFSPNFTPSPLPNTPLGLSRSASLPMGAPPSPGLETEGAVQGMAAQAPSAAMHKYGAAAQQTYTMVTAPMPTAPPAPKDPPADPTKPLAPVLQLIGHGQLDDISGVSMYSTAHSVYLKCQPTVLQGMPELTLALCRPPMVLAPPTDQSDASQNGDTSSTPPAVRDPILHCCYQIVCPMQPWMASTAHAPGCWGLLVLAWSDARGEALCSHCLPVAVPLSGGSEEGPAAGGGPMVAEEALPPPTEEPIGEVGQTVSLAQAVVRLSSAVYAALGRAAGDVHAAGGLCRLIVERLGAMPKDEARQWQQVRVDLPEGSLDSLVVVALTVPPLQRLSNPWDDCSGPHLTLPAAGHTPPRSANVVWAPSPPSHALLPGEVEVVRQLHVRLVHRSHPPELQRVSAWPTSVLGSQPAAWRPIATNADTSAVLEAAGRLHALGTLSMVYQGMVLKQPMASNGMGLGLAGYAGPLAHLPTHCLAVHTMASLLHDVMAGH